MEANTSLALDLNYLLGITQDPELIQRKESLDATISLQDSAPPPRTALQEVNEFIPTIGNSNTQVSSPIRLISPTEPVSIAYTTSNLDIETPSSVNIPTEIETITEIHLSSSKKPLSDVDDCTTPINEAPSSSTIRIKPKTFTDVDNANPNPIPIAPSISAELKTYAVSNFGNTPSKSTTDATSKACSVRSNAKPSDFNPIAITEPSSSNTAYSFNPARSNRPTFFNPARSNTYQSSSHPSAAATAPFNIAVNTTKEVKEIANSLNMHRSTSRERANEPTGGYDGTSLFISHPMADRRVFTNGRGNITGEPISSPINPEEEEVIPHQVPQTAQTTAVAHANDSDNDFVEIDPRNAPMAAKRRWRVYQTLVIDDDDDDDDVVVKKEQEAGGTELPPSHPIRIGDGVQLPVPSSVAQTPRRPTAGRMNEQAERSYLPGHPKRQNEPINAHPASNSSPSGPSVAARKAKPVDGSSSAAADHHKPANPEASNSKKRCREDQSVPDDTAQVEAAMHDDEEDHSWMEEDVDLEEDYKALTSRIHTLNHKYNNEKITHKEKLELFKLRTDKIVKDRLRAAARNHGFVSEVEDPGLFVEETQQESNQRHRREHEESFATRFLDPEEEVGDLHPPSSSFQDSERPASKDDNLAFEGMLRQELDEAGLEGFPIEKQLKSKPRKQRKKAGPRPKNAREFREQQREKDRARNTAKPINRNPKGRKGAMGKGKAAKGKSKGKGKAAKGNDDGTIRPGFDQLHQFAINRDSGKDDVGLMILDELANHDPINDRIHNSIFEVESEPAIFGNNKETQLQKLYANVPAGSSIYQAKCDKKKLKEASMSFGYSKVRAKDGKWVVKGMKSALYHHQLIGAQWMISRELAESAPYGGILAVGMGLGKTVQTLACMVGNPPADGDMARKIKATLIVVPSAVISQWMDEIRNHAQLSAFPKIIHYKTSSKIPEAVLLDLDIVLTSYYEVMSQFPFPDQQARQSIAQIGYKKWWKNACESLGDLHKIKWYRVVLDEAHAIKNNSARTSLACQNLKSVYRWCLTGTPILNSLEELFPYLRFLKANYSIDWKTFQRHFCDPDADDCHQRIATLLSYTMMRRTMGTTIMNRPIIVLPEPHPEIRYVQFSAEERIIYRITENRFRSILNTYFGSNGGANRINYTTYLVHLLRLRQCTSHPFMLERTIRESWTSEDVNELKRGLSRIKRHTNLPFYEECELWVFQGEEQRKAAQEASDRGEEVSQAPEAMPFGKGTYGHTFNMDSALKTLNEKTMYKRVVCHLCSDLPMQPTMTDCGHIFCKDCITDHMHTHAAQYEDDIFPCPSCDKSFQNITPYKGLHVDDEDGSSEGDSTPGDSGKRQKTANRGNKDKARSDGDSKGTDLMEFEPTTIDSSWISQSDHDPSLVLTPSSKTAALKAILLKGFTEAPLDKVVIYVQFRLLARIVGRICQSEGWGFLYLTGDSSLEHRSKAIQMFRTNPDAKILIAGLKCGGLGLNFPWANRCISLDVWWNHAVEQQAFGRIFRIGQNKETYMTRIVVRNTVDMRLLSMQNYKMKTCNRVMRDGDKVDDPALELKDLARLFGFLRTDDDGNIIGIEADYDDGDNDDDLMEEAN